MAHLTRRRFLSLAALAPLAGTLGCRGGVPTLFGYQLGAEALYDPNIRTVYVRSFQNRAFQTTPYRGIEVEITKAVIDEIGRVTSFRVISDPDKADTELIGVVVAIDKQLRNRTQQNTTREGEVQVSVDIIWRDLRDGTILSAPRKPRLPNVAPTSPPGADQPPVPFDPNVPVVPPQSVPAEAVPTRITAFGRYIPELGETNASATKRVQNQLAQQIVSMMEKKW
jgi:hypothetical protein